jgi:hypothetical protein
VHSEGLPALTHMPAATFMQRHSMVMQIALTLSTEVRCQ